MAFKEITALLGGWPGFELVDVKREEVSEQRATARVVLTLKPVADYPKTCSQCGQQVTTIHDVTPREIRDLPILEAETLLVLPRARVLCPRCGPTVESVPWLDRYQRMTKRLAELLARMARVMPIKQVAELCNVSWDTVKEIDKRALRARLGPMEKSDFSNVRRIAIDEFALHRGHRYATLVVDVDTKRVLWVNRGRDAEALTGFFEALGKKGRERIEAVVIDMARPFVKAVKTHLPHAAIVYDLFHALQRYTAQVLDRVRMDEANKIARSSRDRHRLRTENLRRIITGKGARWLLLRDRSNLRSSGERVRLEELLAANQSLFVVYVLKEDLRELWRLRDPILARESRESWYQRALESGIAAMMRFANRLQLEAEYIINHALHPLHTSLLEGINNKIKVMKRMAFGYRDEDYFFLKIRAAFPGIP